MSEGGRNPLASLLINALRDLQQARAETARYREMVSILLEMQADKIREVEASRRHVAALRDELRRHSSRVAGVAA